jgi:hypothetical protein
MSFGVVTIEKKKQSAMESIRLGKLGRSGLRPYTKGFAIDCGKARRPGGASPAPTKAAR